MKAMTYLRLGGAVALAALLADQFSKNLLLYGLGFIQQGRLHRIEVLPFFDLVMVWNRGVSYGLFPAEGPLGTVLITLFQLSAAALMSWLLVRAERPLLAVSLGLLIGGALGNVIDRILYGAVADFFHFYAMGFNWYVFNIADAAITIGVIVLIVDAVVRPDGKSKRPDREPIIRE